MKRDFDTVLLNLMGKPFDDNATLQTVCLMVLTAQLDSDRSQSVQAKLACYKLAQKLLPGGIVDVTSEEITLLKDRVGAMCSVIVVGRVFDLLEADPIA